MNFEAYRDNIIKDFVEDCIYCGTMSKGQILTDEQIDEINKSFEPHRKCFESAKDDAMELIVSCIYGDSVSSSIECLKCNEVIIDDEVLFNQ